MPGTPFRLNRSGLLLALISAAFAGQAHAAAGRVEFSVGPATVVGTDGRTRPAARGVELDTGDTVRTNAGRVQVRMTDGAYISLQPNTEFGIKDYKFEGRTDGSENALYSLLKGAMRTVTGLIGRVNRNKFLVSTPTATVGIRGTGGVIEVLADGGTLVQGTSGIWYLANPAGTIDIPAGVSGVAPADPKQPPQETTSVPTSGPAPLPPQQEFVQGNQTEPGGTTVISPPPPPTGILSSGGGYMAAMFFGDSSLFQQRFDFYTNADATFDGLGRMTSISDLGLGFYSLAGGSHLDSGTDGVLAWGRWVGPVSGDSCGDGCTLSENYTTNQGFHYVVGLPTPTMPTSGQATYTLLGATQPTYVGGSPGPGTLTGNLSVDFAALTVGLNLNVAMPDTTYLLRGDANITSGTPVFNGSVGQGVTVSGGGCFSGCDALVAGFFAGTNAARAGLGYHINDFGNFKEVVGTAAFTKQ